MIETTDHDQGSPPLHSGSGGVLIPVLIDGRRWAMVPPGDPIADHLVDCRRGGRVMSRHSERRFEKGFEKGAGQWLA